MNVYKLLLKHDEGTVTINTAASSDDAVIKKVMDSELCPRSSIKEVWKLCCCEDEKGKELKREELKVVRAAILDKWGGVHSVPIPQRHHDIINTLGEKGFKKQDMVEQGFLLNDGRFVMRKAAAKVAIKAGQCKSVQLPARGLLSEDVW